MQDYGVSFEVEEGGGERLPDYLQFGGGSRAISASSRWILKYSTTDIIYYIFKHTKTTAISEYGNESDRLQHLDTRAHGGRPRNVSLSILKNYIFWHLKCVWLVLLVTLRALFRLLSKITVYADIVKLTCKLGMNWRVSIRQIIGTFTLRGNFKARSSVCWRSRGATDLPFSGGGGRLQGSGATTPATSGAFTTGTIILRGSPLALRWGTHYALLWHHRHEVDIVGIHVGNR